MERPIQSTTGCFGHKGTLVSTSNRTGEDGRAFATKQPLNRLGVVKMVGTNRVLANNAYRQILPALPTQI